ncbi:viral protein 2 [Beet cryptic virus 2]|uniref:Viral protein 2 n=1 Tax=Beet cryptic virus 2 TaxID=912029 RepID=E3W851_9VIRU|nr:viral protein 2 [Beet cryptic virus 2]ADP24758.1 viral protein 2 [Beet cryptic virus 2]
MAPNDELAANLQGLKRPALDEIVHYLEDRNQIGISHDKNLSYNRTCVLLTNELHARLVTLYTNLFTTSWRHFKSAVRKEMPRTEANPQRWLANCYITAWFWDLQASIQEATKTLSGKIYQDYFRDNIHPILDRYDPFLQHLNTIIKPTHIVNATEDVLYFPIISADYRRADADMNIHRITGAFTRPNVVMDLVSLMDDPNSGWSTVPLNTNVFGRPGWLLDYDGTDAYAWFPMENNYNMCDLIAPHILATPCTAKLGIYDADIWQNCPGNIPITATTARTARRESERRFYGSAETRTIEQRNYTVNFPELLKPRDTGARALVTTTQRASTSGSVEPTTGAQPEPETPTFQITFRQFRILDYCYLAKVIHKSNSQMINKALRNFIQKGASKKTE